MPRTSRPLVLRSSVLGIAVALVVPVLAASPARAEEPTAAGETLVGELVQGFADPAPHDHPGEGAGHVEEGTQLLSWVQTAPGEAVRVPTEEVLEIENGATVEVVLGDPVVDEASQEGLEPALEVLSADVLAGPDEPAAAPATSPVNHRVTVVMLQPAGSQPDGTLLSQVVAAVDGPVADFWEQETRGAIRFGVTATVDWGRPATVGCEDPFALWQQAAERAAWTRQANSHLLVYVPAGAPGCEYGLGTIGRSADDGGLAYVRATTTSLVAHEFGHNLGLGHASLRQCDGVVDAGPCRDQAYSDFYDVMGVSWQQVGSLNAPHAARLGVLPADQWSAITATDAGRTLTLAPYAGGTGTRAVRLTDSGGAVYWLEYRTPTGRDAWLGSTSTNRYGLDSGVLLRRATPLPDTSALLDGTPSPRAGWSSDGRVALVVGRAVPVGDGSLTVTVAGADPAQASIAIRTAADVAQLTSTGAVASVRSTAVLSGGHSLTSANGRYRMVFQSDGNLVVYADGGRVAWASGRSAAGGRLVVQPDGNLVVYAADGRPAWAAGTSAVGGVLHMQDDGNLVLYRLDGTPLWASGGDQPNVLRSGQALTEGQALPSRDGRHRALVQTDGNVVVYGPTGAVWASRTGGRGVRLLVQTDGNLVLYSAAGHPLWATGTGNAGAVSLVMQDDGNLVLYRVGGAPVWAAR